MYHDNIRFEFQKVESFEQLDRSRGGSAEFRLAIVCHAARPEAERAAAIAQKAARESAIDKLAAIERNDFADESFVGDLFEFRISRFHAAVPFAVSPCKV